MQVTLSNEEIRKAITEYLERHHGMVVKNLQINSAATINITAMAVGDGPTTGGKDYDDRGTGAGTNDGPG